MDHGDEFTVADADALTTTRGRDTALACLRDAVESVAPERVVADAVSVEGDELRVGDRTFDLRDYDEIAVVGGGKAGHGVASALERVLGDRISAGAVVVPDVPEADPEWRIDRLPGDHPVPSEAGVESTRRVVELTRDADAETLVLAVITGGGSAILPAPVEGVPLDDLRTTTNALLDAGAEIGDLNAVRKHLSTLKGGGLAELAAPATVVGILLSDVVGNDLSVIASGPTAPDATTYDDALVVLDRYGVDAPESVRAHLEAGARGDREETPGAGDPAFDRVTNVVVADGFTALSAARETARDRGYETCILSSRVRGEAREAATTHVAVAEESLATGNPVSPPAVVLSGGETTVTVRGDGEGGPNLEFALSAALSLPEGATLAAADSDGCDGGTDVAGAVVDADTFAPDDRDAARAALDDNDALPALEGRDAVLRTGPTGTNVNDVRVLVVESPEEDEGGD